MRSHRGAGRKPWSREGLRSVGVVATALLLVGSAACGGSSESSEGGGGGSGEDDPIQVRVITVTPTNTGTWDPAQRASYDAAAEANGWELQTAEAVAYGDADQVLSQWGSEGVDVVFSTDNGYEESLLAAATQYPETAWVMMSALSTTNDLPNVGAYNFDWCEFGYLQGAIAGLVTSSGKVGGVASIDILPVQQAFAAQQLGAEAVRPGTEVIRQDTGDFIDVQKAQTVTAGLVGRGADVIVALAHGGVSPQVAAEAQSLGAYYVGSFMDESESAPEATAASVVIDFQEVYEEAVQSWTSGDFDASITTRGVAEGMITATPLAQGFEDRQSELDAVVEQLTNGEIDWPEGPCSGA